MPVSGVMEDGTEAVSVSIAGTSSAFGASVAAGCSVAWVSTVAGSSVAVFVFDLGCRKPNQSTAAAIARMIRKISHPLQPSFLFLNAVIFRIRIRMTASTMALNSATSAYQYGVLSLSTCTAALLAWVYRMLWQASRMAIRAVLLEESMDAPIRHSIMSLPARTARLGSIQLVFAMAESVTTMPTKPHSLRRTSVIRGREAPAHTVPRWL